MYLVDNLKKTFINVMTLVILAGLATVVVVPLLNYSIDLSNIKNGTVVDKYATSSILGGSSFYVVLQNDDANIRYPFFIPEDNRKHTNSVLVTEDTYDKVSVGENYSMN
jgi:hypothetical protein